MQSNAIQQNRLKRLKRNKMQSNRIANDFIVLFLLVHYFFYCILLVFLLVIL